MAKKKPPTRPKLNASQEKQVFTRVSLLRGRFMARDRTRFTRLLARPRFRERFLDDAYETYLAQGGKAGSPAEFFQWLLQFVLDNQDAILAFIKALMSLFA